MPSVQASGGLSKSQKKKAKAKAAAARKQAAAEAGEGSIEQNGSPDAGIGGPVSSTATAGGANHAPSRAHKLLAAQMLTPAVEAAHQTAAASCVLLQVTSRPMELLNWRRPAAQMQPRKRRRRAQVLL